MDEDIGRYRLIGRRRRRRNENFDDDDDDDDLADRGYIRLADRGYIRRNIERRRAPVVNGRVNDIILNDFLPNMPLRIGGNQLTPRQYDMIMNPEMYGRGELTKVIEGYLKRRLGLGQHRGLGRRGPERNALIAARRVDFNDRIANIMQYPQIQNFINRGRPRGIRRRRARIMPFIRPRAPNPPNPIGNPDVLLNWRGLDEWNDLVANPGNYRVKRIRAVARQMVNRVIKDEFKRADRQAGIRGALPAEDRPARNRIIRERVNYVLQEPFFQRLYAEGIREPRVGRGGGERRERREDPYWFWNYNKIHTSARGNPALDAQRKASSNAAYKAFLKREMIAAARVWRARYRDSIISHGL